MLLNIPPTCANVVRSGGAIKYRYVQGIDSLRKLQGGNTLEDPLQKYHPFRSSGLIAGLIERKQWLISHYWGLIPGVGMWGGVGWPVYNVSTQYWKQHIKTSFPLFADFYLIIRFVPPDCWQNPCMIIQYLPLRMFQNWRPLNHWFCFRSLGHHCDVRMKAVSLPGCNFKEPSILETVARLPTRYFSELVRMWNVGNVSGTQMPKEQTFGKKSSRPQFVEMPFL